MKAILIDPAAQTVTEYTIANEYDYRALYPIIGCDTFTVPTYLPNGDALFCDDEGLLKEGPFDVFTIDVGDAAFDIVGRGLILGTDVDGESTDAKSTPEEVAAMVTFKGKQYAEIEPFEQFGPNGEYIIGSRAVFTAA